LGLKNWCLTYEHGNVGNLIKISESDQANCLTDSESRIVTLGLGEEVEDESTIDYLSIHEVFELLLAEYDSLARSRYATEKELEKARHSVITVLENTFHKDFLRTRCKKYFKKK